MKSLSITFGVILIGLSIFGHTNNLKAISVYQKVGFVRETTYIDFGNLFLLFLASDGFPAKEHNFEMPLDKGTIHQSDLSYMREVLTPVFANKICRQIRKANLALSEMSDSSLYQHHIKRIDSIQRSLRILQQRR